MNRSLIILIWFFVNVIFLSIMGHYHIKYHEHEYVVKGRGSSAIVVTKAQDPEYYHSRMKYLWTGYILAPLLSGWVLYRKTKLYGKKKKTS